MKLSFFLLVSLITSAVHSVDFCDQTLREILFDTVFQYNDTIYAYRKKDGVFILKTDANGNWTQVYDAIPLHSLFQNFPRKSFDAAFIVWDFAQCDEWQDVRCPYKSKDFNALDVTFVFSGRNFYVYHRKHETLFEPVIWPTNQDIPWNVTHKGSSSIKEVFGIDFDKLDYYKVDGAVFYVWDWTSPKRNVLLWSNTLLKRFELTDNLIISEKHNLTNRLIVNRKYEGNGGMIKANATVFFVLSGILYDMKTTVWYREDWSLETTLIPVWDDYDCDHMPPRTTTTPIITTTEDIWSSNETEDENQTITETIDLSSEFNTDVTDSEETPEVPTTEFEPTFSRQTEKTTDTDIHTVIDEETKYRQNLKNILYITFVLTSVSMIAISILSFFCFKILF